MEQEGNTMVPVVACSKEHADRILSSSGAPDIMPPPHALGQRGSRVILPEFSCSPASIHALQIKVS
jgi:hypothetical protein